MRRRSSPISRGPAAGRPFVAASGYRRSASTPGPRTRPTNRSSSNTTSARRATRSSTWSSPGAPPSPWATSASTRPPARSSSCAIPGPRREAEAREPDTTILAVGGKPGEAFRPRAWETNLDVLQLFDDGRYGRPRSCCQRALERYDDSSTIFYNLACAEAQLGETDAALQHLSRGRQRAAVAGHRRAPRLRPRTHPQRPPLRGAGARLGSDGGARRAARACARHPDLHVDELELAFDDCRGTPWVCGGTRSWLSIPRRATARALRSPQSPPAPVRQNVEPSILGSCHA